MLRLRIGAHGRAHGMGTIVSRDARGDAFGGLDRQREIGPLSAIGVADHQRQAQLRAALARERQADQPTPEAGHEIDVLGPHALGRHDQVALVLAVLIVHDHDHASGAQLGQDFLDRIEAAGAAGSARSRGMGRVDRT